MISMAASYRRRPDSSHGEPSTSTDSTGEDRGGTGDREAGGGDEARRRVRGVAKRTVGRIALPTRSYRSVNPLAYLLVGNGIDDARSNLTPKPITASVAAQCVSDDVVEH